MTEPTSIQQMWRAYLNTVDETPETTQRAFSAWSFGDSPEMADELGGLVLAGRKRATASALWVYQQEGSALPQPGDLSIITDAAGEAMCVIRTTSIENLPFDQVPADFAAAEGEGDLSLAYWLAGHRRFFTRELASIGMRFTPDMPVVCERFEVVYPSAIR